MTSGIKCGTCGEVEPQKWINVDDELPQDREFVLAFNGQIHEALINDHAGAGIGMIWGSSYAPDNWGLRSVTHWMPFPEPPK